MTTSEQLVNAAIAEQARGWFVANEEGPLGAQETAVFATWLRTSPEHVRAFLRVSGIAHDLKAVGEGPEFSLAVLLEEAQADNADRVVALESTSVRGARPIVRRQVTRYAWVLAAVVGVLIFGGSLAWWSRDGERFGFARTYETAHGEQGAWRLPDGSTLHLNTDSSARVHYSKMERVVDVNRGQALFEAVSGDRRRFRVSAGLTQVLAVGTEFDVYRRRDTTAVTVVEGTVTVCACESPPPDRAAAPSVPFLQVSAGEQATVVGGTLAAKPMPVDAKAAVAWLQRQIVAEDQPLQEIAEEFNRYGRVRIEIDDPALQALRVSGRFDVYDTESLAAFLASLDGVAFERTATRIRVIRVGANKGDPPPSDR
jgi:transmembrane sensor